MKFVSLAGLEQFLTNIKSWVTSGFVGKEAGKGLSSNDYTTTEKNKLAGLNNYSHPNSGVTAGTYKSVTVNAQGHVTGGTNPTTLSGYGITDAAAKSHTHGNADITALDAGKITSGTISIDRLPKGALERCVVVADDAARLKLTTATVQVGDTVKVTSTGLMYFVVDDTKLTTEAGYEVYTAGSATSVPWSGVTGKPSTFAPSAHNHDDKYYTESEMDTKLGNKVDKVSGKQLSTEDYTTAEKNKLAGLSNYTHPTTAGNKHIPAGGSSGQILRWSADGTAAWGADNNTTYTDFKAATASAAGSNGLVPAPAAGKQSMYLRGDGTWQTPTDTRYTHPTGDGNMHVPVTGTTNNGKFLQAGSTAGAVQWAAVSKSTVGLGNVDNTSDANKPVSTAQQTALNNKVDKVSGKGLSTNDYTAAEKTKLSGIATGAQVNVLEAIKVNGTALTPASKAVNIDLTSYAKTADMVEVTSAEIDALFTA